MKIILEESIQNGEEEIQEEMNFINDVNKYDDKLIYMEKFKFHIMKLF